VTPVLKGDAPLIDIATGNKLTSQQSDSDSLKVDSAGDLVLDSQADGDLIFINSPGSPNQASLLLHLSDGSANQITVDDTVFPTAPSGTIFVVDTKGDAVYAVKSDAFQPGGAYSASDSDGILGKVDLSTGLVTPIVSGMKTPHGALFLPAVQDVHVYRDEDLSLQGANVDAEFVVTRAGDISGALVVNYSVQDLGSEREDDRKFNGTVTIPAGKSRTEFEVPIASLYEILEDRFSQSVTLTLVPGKGYNLSEPDSVSVNLKR
jgi:hypothetical protein